MLPDPGMDEDHVQYDDVKLTSTPMWIGHLLAFA